jgi:hypothetical protein
MPSRRQVLRTAGAAGGIVFAGQAAAARGLDGERLDVQQTETPVVTVDRQITDSVPNGPRTSVKHRYPFIEGDDGTVYVSESDDKPAFNPYDGVVVAESTNNLQSTSPGSRVSLTGGLQSFHSAAGGVVGEIESTVALDTSERPAAGVRVVGDGVSVAVAPGESKTVEVTGAFQPSGEEVTTSSATVEVTVEHRGVRSLVTHPTATLTPKDHRLGRLAAEAYSRQSDAGSLSFERSTFEVRHDERGFFAHEEVETHIGTPDESVSTQAADTDALIIGTDEYGGKPTDGRDTFENVFERDTESSIIVDADNGVSLNSPSSFDDAWSQVQDSSRVDSELNDYDCVMVVDNRSYSGSTGGRAYVGTAGGGLAYGYCESENLGTIVHECGHVYGGDHEGSTTYWRRFGVIRHDVMGYIGVDPDCQGKKPGYLRDRSYRGCTADRINEIVDGL